MERVDCSKLTFLATSKQACSAELAEARWSDGFVCRACGCRKAYFIKTRKVYECANKRCKCQTSATAGTQFHGSRILEKLWLVLRQISKQFDLMSKAALRDMMKVSYKTLRKAEQTISLTVPNQKTTKGSQTNQEQSEMRKRGQPQFQGKYHKSPNADNESILKSILLLMVRPRPPEAHKIRVDENSTARPALYPDFNLAQRLPEFPMQPS